MTDLETLERAWTLAHKVLCLARGLRERRGADRLKVSTATLVAAMGQADSAAIDQVQRFVYRVLAYLRPYDLHLVCGCGYLFLLVGEREPCERAFDDGRELADFEPADLDAEFADWLENAASAGGSLPKPVCEVDSVS